MYCVYILNRIHVFAHVECTFFVSSAHDTHRHTHSLEFDTLFNIKCANFRISTYIARPVCTRLHSKRQRERDAHANKFGTLNCRKKS